MKWWGVLALVALSGCGRDYNVGPFASYVETFKLKALQAGRPVSIGNLEMSLKQVSGDLQGYCTVTSKISFDGAFSITLVPTVYIDPDVWESSDEWNREAVVMHELGHCVLGRGHDSSQIPSQDGSTTIPKTIMNPDRFDSAIYSQNRDYYLTELFTAPSP